VADNMFTSPHNERLEAALARYEATGHLAVVALTALAQRLTPGHEQTDPASQLAAMLDKATRKLQPSKRTRARVAGLIPTPAEPIADDMQTPLTERQTLIETAAGRLADEAQSAGASWASRLGKPPTQPRARTQWQAHAATIAPYRYRQHRWATRMSSGALTKRPSD